MPQDQNISLFSKPDDMSLEQWQIALRKLIAEKENFRIEYVPNSFGDFIVHNCDNNNQYKVTYRGEESEWNYCSCMDFKTSQLGTCKHIEAVRLSNPAIVLELPPYSSVYLSYYGPKREVKIRIGYEYRSQITEISKKYFDKDNVLNSSAYNNFSTLVEELSAYNVKIYDDVLKYVSSQRDREKRENILSEKYSDAEIDVVLNTKLYKYQKEGVRFAFRNGKAIIADEMGLGKTVQAICTSEIYRKEKLIQDTLIVCPTSLKYQWKKEIERFTGSNAIVIEGNHKKRLEQYDIDVPYKIVSYNSICNDIKTSDIQSFDLIIMDEVQRLKNWNTQIAKAIRKLESVYSIILTGTPLENKLDELYSIVQLADQYCLGPYYKFRTEHIITDSNGKILGYKNLNSIKEKLSKVLIRRKKSEVKLQLPGRINKNLIIPVTKEQMDLHNEFRSGVVRIADKWRKMKVLSETDRLRLMILLGNMRMVCDSTFILDQKTRHDTKVEEVINIVKEIVDCSDEKIVIFSQWERMTRIIASDLNESGINYEYLYGGIPSEKRKNIIDNFTENPKVRVFLSTDAGGTGLNLQVASIVINVDLPWNPAVLEQRIARIWRIGQQRNIQVINLVAQGTIEEGMIGRLKFKSAMAEGALDGGNDTVYMDENKFGSIVDTIGSFLTDKEAPTSSNISINKGIDFMMKLQKLLSSKSVCNMIVGAMSMDDPTHIQNHMQTLEENKKNIDELIKILRSIKTD